MNIYKNRKAKLESAYSFMLKYSKITVCNQLHCSFTYTATSSNGIFDLMVDPLSEIDSGFIQTQFSNPLILVSFHYFDAPRQGPQGCLEKQNHSLNSNLVVWCAKTGPKT